MSNMSWKGKLALICAVLFFVGGPILAMIMGVDLGAMFHINTPLLIVGGIIVVAFIILVAVLSAGKDDY